MAEYFNTKEEAEAFIIRWHHSQGKPSLFGKILLHEKEKWIVDYQLRDYSFEIIEDCTIDIANKLAKQ